MKRYVLLCAVSGMGWAVIAYFIAGRLGGAALWGGLVTAPLIGVIAGWVYRTGPSLALAWQAGDVIVDPLSVRAPLWPGLGHHRCHPGIARRGLEKQHRGCISDNFCDIIRGHRYRIRGLPVAPCASESLASGPSCGASYCSRTPE